MSDIGPGNPQDLRIPLEMTRCEFRQLPVISGGKILESLLNMLLGGMKIVDQPFGRRRYGLSARHDIEQDFMRLVEGGEISAYAVQQCLGRGEAFDDGLMGGKAFGMLAHAENAENLRPDRSIVLPAGFML